jgi:hypothetical protein
MAGVTPEAREAACRASVARADARAGALAPVIAEIRASGITEPYAIATALTARGVPRRLDRLPSAGPLGSQIESRESPHPGKPTAGKRERRKPVPRKALLSASGLKSALRQLS